MIMTAEPYSAVRQPSDVVVMENMVRPDTIGKTEPIQAKYELLPRGSYTYTRPSGAVVAEGPKVSMDRYESLLEIYQAQNAIQIARAHGADKYASETLAKAEGLLTEAQQMEAHKLGRSAVVTAARQSAQTAEDARTIAVKRAQDAELADARATAAQERERREAAERAAQEARTEASEQKAGLEQERLNRERAEASAAVAAPKPAPEVILVPAPGHAERQSEARKSELRSQLMRRMNSYFPTTDTPRGLVITLHDRDFRGAIMDPAMAARVANLAAMIAAEPGLRVEVDGHTDAVTSRGEQISNARASSVRDTMVRGGMSSKAVLARDMGNERPLVSNATVNGREQNRRVEIVVSGDPIGYLAHWDRSYSVR
jgi:flagellar motor protein MotB